MIGQKSGWNVRNERRILRKSTGGGGSLAFFITFGIKTTLDYLSKKSKRGVLCIFDTFWDPNDSWLSVKKVKNMLDNIGAFWGKNMLSRGKEGLEHFWWKGVLRICGTGREGGGKGLQNLWHLLGSKSQFIISQKSLEIIAEYWEKFLLRGGRGSLEHLCNLLGSKWHFIIGHTNQNYDW